MFYFFTIVSTFQSVHSSINPHSYSEITVCILLLKCFVVKIYRREGGGAGWGGVIYCQLMHINTKHQLTAGQSKLAKGYFFCHTRDLMRKYSFLHMWTLKVTCLLMIQMRGKWHSKCISVHVPVKGKKNAYIMYNYTAANTLVLYTDTNLDTQNIHWYTKRPFTRIHPVFSLHIFLQKTYSYIQFTWSDQNKTWKIHDIQAFSQ